MTEVRTVCAIASAPPSICESAAASPLPPQPGAGAMPGPCLKDLMAVTLCRTALGSHCMRLQIMLGCRQCCTTPTCSFPSRVARGQTWSPPPPPPPKTVAAALSIFPARGPGKSCVRRVPCKPGADLATQHAPCQSMTPVLRADHSTASSGHEGPPFCQLTPRGPLTQGN